MDSAEQHRYQTALALADSPSPISSAYVTSPCSSSDMRNESEDPNASEIMTLMHSGQMWMVNARRKNGLILYKRYYAEFAGPGAAVGGIYDQDCEWALPVGNLSLLSPETHDQRQKAYLIRRQWIRLTKGITDNKVPQQRAQRILEQFEYYFDADTVAQLPDEAFALLVGVLPQTVRVLRRTAGSLNE